MTDAPLGLRRSMPTADLLRTVFTALATSVYAWSGTAVSSNAFTVTRLQFSVVDSSGQQPESPPSPATGPAMSPARSANVKPQSFQARMAPTAAFPASFTEPPFQAPFQAPLLSPPPRVSRHVLRPSSCLCMVGGNACCHLQPAPVLTCQGLVQALPGLDSCPQGRQCTASFDMVLAASTGAVPAPYAVYMALTTSTFQARAAAACRALHVQCATLR